MEAGTSSDIALQSRSRRLRLFKPERTRVLIAYDLLIVEEIALLALPALIGITVDRLLNGDRSGLFLLAGGVSAILVSGALRGAVICGRPLHG